MTPGLLASGSRSSVSTGLPLNAEWSAYHNTYPDNQAKLQSAFKAAFKKMAVLGHNINDLIDCSEVIPVPKNVAVKPAHLPAGNTLNDIEQAVSFLESLSTCTFTDHGFTLVRDHSLPLALC